MWIPAPLTIREGWLELHNLLRRNSAPPNPVQNLERLHSLIDVFVFFPYLESED